MSLRAAIIALLILAAHAAAGQCISYSLTICEGAPAYFSGECGPGYVYRWTINGQMFHGPSLEYTFASPGDHTVSVSYFCLSDGNPFISDECANLPGGSETFTVNVLPRAVAPQLAPDKTSVCQGGSVTITISNAHATGSAVTWRSVPPGYTALGTTATFTNITGYTEFIARVGRGDCSVERSVYIPVTSTTVSLPTNPPAYYRKRVFEANELGYGHYLQASPDGQSLASPLTQDNAVFEPGNYYSRAYNITSNCWAIASAPVAITIDYTPPRPLVTQVQRYGYNELFLANGFSEELFQFADVYVVSSPAGTETTKPFSDKYIVSEPTTIYVRLRDKHTGTWGPGATVHVALLGDQSLNFVRTIAYDGSPSNTPISESKAFFDQAGKPLQTQTKSFAHQKVIASQTINDRYDRPVLTALPVPLDGAQFRYHEGLMLAASDDRKYNHTHFDDKVTNTQLNPVPLAKEKGNTLGWYYSQSNAREDRPAQTDFPYSRIVYYEDGSGEVKMAAGPGESHRLGSGHEVLSGTFPVIKELDYYKSLRALAIPGINERNSTYNPNQVFRPGDIKGVQKVVRDENGKWAVSITDKEGRTILSGRPGAWDELGGIRIDNNFTASANPADADYNPLIYVYLYDARQVTLANEGAGQSLDYSIEELIQGVPFTGNVGTTSWPVGFYRINLKSGRLRINYTNYLVDVSMQFYDDAGRLRTSVSPNGVKQYRMDNRPFDQIDKTEYQYNFQGWLLEMTEPDAGRTRYQYRRDGNIRFSQNAQQALDAHFSYTQYDDIGRPVESGEYVGATTFEQARSLLEYQHQPQWSASDKRDWLKTSYDLPDADFLSATQLDGLYTQRFTRGAVSFTENENIKTWYSYDELGRVTWMAQKPKALTRVFVVEYGYDFLGNVLRVTQKSFEAGAAVDQFHHYYEYDADKRLSRALTSADGVKKILQATYSYYAHGPLKRIELATNLQGIDFVYNIHGWLTSINHPDPLQDPGRDGLPGEHGSFRQDAFGMLLDYYNSDFTSLLTAAKTQPLAPDPNRYHGLPASDSRTMAATAHNLGITPAFDVSELGLKAYSAEMPIYSQMVKHLQQQDEKILLTVPTQNDLTVLANDGFPIETVSPIASVKGEIMPEDPEGEDEAYLLPLYDVLWSSLVGASFANNILTKTAVDGWGNSGAASLNVLPAGQDGFLEYVVHNGQKRIVGLTDTDVDAHFNSIRYSWYTISNSAMVYMGASRLKTISFQFGDVLRVERIGSSVLWKKNGVTEHTVTNALTTALIADCSLGDDGTTVAYAKASFWIPSVVPPAPEYDIVWADAVGVSVNGNTITKTASSGWGNGGAASVNQLPANIDGWVEYRLDQQNGRRLMGLSDVNTDAGYNTIDYAWYTSANEIYVYVNGVNQRTLPAATGDVLRVERVGTTIYFKQNGVSVHTLTNVLTTALIADASIHETGVKITHAKASFWIPPVQGAVPDLWEFQALKALYDSCNGPSWRNRTNWPTAGNWPTSATATQMDAWFGIAVAHGDITGITMDYNAVNGRLPQAIGNLTELRALNLQRNALTRLPASLGNLINLTTINLYMNQLAGILPDLSRLADLVHFNIANNPTLTPAPVPPYLATCTKLTYLSMANTKRTGTLPTMSALLALRSLVFDNNQLTGSIPSGFGGLPNLVEFRVTGNQLSGPIPPDLCHATTLTTLDLSYNQLSGAIPGSISRMVNLVNLHLNHNQLTGLWPYLGELTKLRVLRLAANPFTPAIIPDWIGNLKQLITLNLTASARIGSIPAELANLTQLELLTLDQNKLSGSIPASLSSLTALTQLFLYDNEFTGTVPESLGTLPAVTHLFLHINKLSGAVPTSFLNLPSITYLYLNNNDFTSIPNFSTALRRDNLYLKIESNRLDYTTVLPTATYAGYRSRVFSPQKELDDIRLINAPQGSTLTIQARPLAPNTTVIWEKQATATTWTNITATNQSGNPGIYSFGPVTAAQAGVYRYRMTNTGTALTLQSAPITVHITDQLNASDYSVGPLYNGNISAISWRTEAAYASESGLPWDGLFMYRYDAKYQLRETQFADPDFSTRTFVLKGNQYRETGMDYDANGNLLGLKRYDRDQTRIHNFAYTYHPITATAPAVLGNRLKAVSGYATSYTYNAIGQMTHQEMVDTDANQFVVYDVSGKVKDVYGHIAAEPGSPPSDPGHPIDPALGVPEGYVLKVRYKYDDRGFRLSKTSYGAAPLSSGEGPWGEVTTWYIRDASGNVLSIYEQKGGTAPIVRTEVPIYGSGRVGMYRPKADGGHEYVYELTDHLGNVRATLKREETVYLATMEDNGALDFTNPRLREMVTFENLFETERRDPYMNKTAPTADEPTPRYSAYLHWIDDGNPATREDIIGPAIALKVEAGDTLNLEVYAKFEKKVSFARNATVAMMSSLLGSSFLNPAFGIETFSQASAVFNGNLSAALANSGDGGDTRPYAYLNYILFDRTYAMITAGAKRVPLNAGFDPGLEMAVAPQLTRFDNPVTVGQAGYVYVWVSNESENSKVWFDDLKVTHRSSRVTQATDFYAWGNVMRENKSPEDARYRYGYQGQFAEKDEETGYNFFELRNYDPIVGRWISTDPYSQYWSPYTGMGNDPINFSDADGGYSRFGAWWRNITHGGNGIYQAGGEWGFNVNGGESFEVNGEPIQGYTSMFGTYGEGTEMTQFVSDLTDRLATAELQRNTTFYERYQAGLEPGHAIEPSYPETWLMPVPKGLGGVGFGAKASKSLFSSAKVVPSHARTIAQTVMRTGKTLQGYVSKNFENREKKLPQLDPNRKPITYKEYDVHPHVRGVDRGAERVVIGSDGRRYYTSDHYKTFTEF